MLQQQQSYADQMCSIFHDFASEHGDEPVDLDELYDWARARKRWDKPTLTLRKIFKREIGRYLRAEKIIDEDGNPVRRNHAIRITKDDKQYRFWTDILTVNPARMQMSLQQRKLVLAAAAIQHDRDTQYYNKHNTFGAQLSFDYNLNPHVNDARHPTDYPDERPREDAD